MSGLRIASWRLLYGAVIYLGILYISGRRTSWRNIRIAVPAAVAIALEIAFFFVAIKLTTIANVTIIGALQPIILLGVASRQFGERISSGLVAASVVALAGVGIVAFGSADQASWSVRGDLLALVATILFAAYFVYAKRAREHVDAFEFQGISMLIGAATLFPILLVDSGGSFEVPSPSDSVWLLVLLAVPGTGHLLMNWAHPKVRLSLTSMLTLAVPVLTTGGAVVFLGDSVNALQVVGMAVVLSALAIVVRNDIRAPA